MFKKIYTNLLTYLDLLSRVRTATHLTRLGRVKEAAELMQNNR